jgi:hypothetical protein
MIFALRSSTAMFCRRYQSTANAQGRRHPIKAKGGEVKNRANKCWFFHPLSKG